MRGLPQRVAWIVAVTGSVVGASRGLATTAPASTAVELPPPLPRLHCAAAQRLGVAQRRQGAATAGTWLLAQAALCRGLLRDDAWALEAALPLIDAVATERPGDAFAQIDRADAWCARYPASAQAEAALAAALAAATADRLGAVWSAARSRLQRNRGAVRARRAQLVADASALDAPGAPLNPWRLARQADAGPQAARAALATLGGWSAAGDGEVQTRLAEAELMRGRASRGAVRAKYRSIARRFCADARAGARAPHRAVCALARLRAAQLAQAGEETGTGIGIGR